MWGGFNWRYDSGLVAGSAPCYNVTDPDSACPNSSFGPDGLPATLNGAAAVALVDNGVPAGTNPVTGNPVALPLTADQEFQSGLAYAGDRATPTHLIGTPVTAAGMTYYECPANELTTNLLSIPAPGTGITTRAHRALHRAISSTYRWAMTTFSMATRIPGAFG